MWDPEFKFLNMGTVGAIIEIEYMKMLRTAYNMPKLKWYCLGELNHSCSKVNYKLNYKPGYVLCPYTKKWFEYESVKDTILMLENLTIEEKASQLEYIKLNPDQDSEPPIDLLIDDEMIEYVYDQKVMYQGKSEKSYEEINIEKWKEVRMVNGLISLLKSVGFTTYSNFTIEYKKR